MSLLTLGSPPRGRASRRARPGQGASWFETRLRPLLTMRGSSATRATEDQEQRGVGEDRKSTRLNSSHQISSYAVFCLKKKKTKSLAFRTGHQSLSGICLLTRLSHFLIFSFFFFFNDTATTEIYTLSLHDALPISRLRRSQAIVRADRRQSFASS